MSYHLFTQEECDFIMVHYQKYNVEQLVHMMGELFGHKYTKGQIKNKITDLQIRKRNLKKNFGKYTPEMCQWLKTHYNTVSITELVKQFNDTFNCDYTKSAVWHKLNRIIEGGIVRDEHTMITRTKWTTEMIDWLKTHYEDDSYNRLAIEINKTFNVKVTGSSIEHKINRLGLKKSKEAIKRGILPNNGCFKKGCIPITKKPIGYERKQPNGVTWIKVAEPNVFRAKHRVIYEQHHGPVPEGMNVIFADGDKCNFNINNLILVSNAELAVMNTNKLYFKGDGEATKVGHTIAKIKLKIREVENAT